LRSLDRSVDVGRNPGGLFDVTIFAVPVNAIVEGMQPIELLMTNLLLVPVEPVVKLRRSIVEQLGLELLWSLTIPGVIAKCI